MLQPDFTPAVMRAMGIAQSRAGRFGLSTIRTEDLLHGLLAEPEGKPATLLSQCGCDLGTLRPSIADTEPAAPEASLPHDRDCENAFFHARNLSRELSGERTIQSEHLLLAILGQDDKLRTQLCAKGLNYASLEERVLGKLAAAIELDEPLTIEDTADRMSAARILDASANRAREAMRVLEDYARFALDDRMLCQELKSMRHDLVAALQSLQGNWFLSARETEHDVGTTVSTASELERESLSRVVAANAARLQESLRSLEEYSKLDFPAVSRILEGLRYRAYTLQRALVVTHAAKERLAHANLYVLLTGSQCRASLDWTIAQAAQGGVDMIQLRKKELSDRELLHRARQCRQWTQKARVLFLVNDRPDIAKLCDADGVHLGQDDLSVKDARRLLGPRAIIGVSTHDLEQVRRAVLEGADYLGVGPVFTSKTKQFQELAGLDFVRAASAATSLPAFALGGINAENLPQVMGAGARRVAISHAIADAQDPCAAAREIKSLLGWKKSSHGERPDAGQKVRR